MPHSHLRQSTAAQSRIIGPFIDEVDFITLETGLTIANTDVKLEKNGAASVNKNSGGGTHRVNGDYSFTWDATDTDTVGELEVSIKLAGVLVAKRTYEVLAAKVYDALYSATSTLMTREDVRQYYESAIATATSNVQFDMTVGIDHDDVWIGEMCTVESIATGTLWPTWITDVDQINNRLFTEATPNGTDSIPFTVLVGDIVRVGGGMHPMFAIERFAPPTRVNATSDMNAILAKLLAYTSLMVRSDAAAATTYATELAAIAGTFDNTTDSLEALEALAAAIKLQSDKLVFDAGGLVASEPKAIHGTALKQNAAGTLADPFGPA